MKTYNLTTVNETTIIDRELKSITTTSHIVPIDGNGDTPLDYTGKNRVIVDNQMIVFDTEQEYRDWLQQNS